MRVWVKVKECWLRELDQSDRGCPCVNSSGAIRHETNFKAFYHAAYCHGFHEALIIERIVGKRGRFLKDQRLTVIERSYHLQSYLSYLLS